MASESTAAPGTGLLGEARTRALLSAVLQQSAADEVEGVLEVGGEALTRFAHNAIHQNVVEAGATLEIRAAFGRRVGVASTNDLSPAGIERVVRQAEALARQAPEKPERPGLPDPAEWTAARPETAIPAYDEAAAGASPWQRAEAVGQICRRLAETGLWASGALSTSAGEFALLNSKGLFAYAPATEVGLTFVVESPTGDNSTYAQAVGWRWSQIDPQALADDAIRRAGAGKQPRVAPAGDYPVVLEPYAVVNLLEALSEAGMGALAVQEDRSWMNGRLGQRCLSHQLTLCDDAYDVD